MTAALLALGVTSPVWIELARLATVRTWRRLR